ncbi:MAG: ATP-binding cassette domain-containing protein [Prevotellaceae bacterium]|jgi:molybdate transport system ATP-binding protein|nr:ATP-binding cassette domain-containing protein [Prevotellaceae bacterium]
MPELQFKKPVNWTIEEGQQWAVVGANGAGKTLLANILTRKTALRGGSVVWNGNASIRQISFHDIYSLTDCRNAYYQQRWHAAETDGIPTAMELLGASFGDDAQALLSMFGLDDVLTKRIIALSGGELRKFLIVKALLARPRVLIIDNPFIGLDASSRQILTETLQQTATLGNLQTVLLLPDAADIPPMVTHVLPMRNRECLAPQTRDTFMEEIHATDEYTTLQALHTKPAAAHRVTLRMEKVSVSYGQRTILHPLDWEVKNGEKWALLGKNGTGKSTLLSLVYADNPQAYAHTIYLFDRRRGTGESIWDIKQRIGFVSPEMHLYYHANVSARQIVASGFFDTIGLHRKCSAEQESAAMEWMDTFNIGHLKDRMFLTLSSGEQRLALLARSFVKNPDLLLLDEPLHGLDAARKRQATRIIEQFCALRGKTLIYVTHYPHELPECINHYLELRKE